MPPSGPASFMLGNIVDMALSANVMGASLSDDYDHLLMHYGPALHIRN